MWKEVSIKGSRDAFKGGNDRGHGYSKKGGDESPRRGYSEGVSPEESGDVDLPGHRVRWGGEK